MRDEEAKKVKHPISDLEFRSLSLSIIIGMKVYALELKLATWRVEMP